MFDKLSRAISWLLNSLTVEEHQVGELGMILLIRNCCDKSWECEKICKKLVVEMHKEFAENLINYSIKIY